MNTEIESEIHNAQAKFAIGLKYWHLLRSGRDTIYCNVADANRFYGVVPGVDDEQTRAAAVERFCAGHDSCTLEISTIMVQNLSLVQSGKCVPSNVDGFFGLALRMPYTPDAVSSLQTFRLPPTRIVKREKVIEGYWHFPVIHRAKEADERSAYQLPPVPYAEYQTTRRNLGAALSVSVTDDGMWAILPQPHEIVWSSDLPYDFSELQGQNITDYPREAFITLAQNGILPGAVNGKTPDRAYSNALFAYLRSFGPLSLESDKFLAGLCKDYGATMWRSAALHGVKFPPLALFRQTLSIRYPDVRWQNDRNEWSTH